MRILQKSIRIINYEQQLIQSRETPESFEVYVNELIDFIGSNESTREYKTRSNATEVIGSIVSIGSDPKNIELVVSKMDAIATRLMRMEVAAQERIERTGTNVQKGSLIQAMLYNEDGGIYGYLLAKVEHTEWVDDADFLFKTGFSKNKKNIWKSCLIDFPDFAATEYHARVYTNTVAKYWCSDFLELDEMNTDETNTMRAVTAIEATIGNSFRGTASPDHTIIRYSFFGYLKNNEHIDFETMVDTVLRDYVPVDPGIKPERVQEIRTKLLEQPQKRNFDRQFNAVNSAINPRVRKTYPVNTGIDLKVSLDIENLKDTIIAVEEAGAQYIKVRTNNEATFNRFRY